MKVCCHFQRPCPDFSAVDWLKGLGSGSLKMTEMTERMLQSPFSWKMTVDNLDSWFTDYGHFVSVIFVLFGYQTRCRHLSSKLDKQMFPVFCDKSPFRKISILRISTKYLAKQGRATFTMGVCDNPYLGKGNITQQNNLNTVVFILRLSSLSLSSSSLKLSLILELSSLHFCVHIIFGILLI